ncbi:penicillin-insensitive murein endopeptidase [bacterium]|uniref:penicillin-insensitive murein endopeptidase n=1 Tax=Salipiger bermudensis TaxID=344736 RepID=UPI001CD2D6BC|nr:penicillin-insensitive murein endopeptidase [Salipiger bermudensis]MBR9890859.1 penicillin-insensitive murein endopeptidase [bacterium]MCA1285341.1 penicillin-insensitive murein endopeptidase [Salipiger bermudensis]
MIRTLTAIAVAALTLAACGGDRPASTVTEEDLPRVTGVLSTKSAKSMFGAEQVGSQQSAAAYGSYSRGCVAGAQQLAETGPTWQAMRLSRNRNWAHPETIDYVQDLSRKAAQLPGWSGLYIGDMSQPRGGPMTSGHASHQIGLDADIWMRPANDLSLSRSARENISSISLRRASGAYTNDNWTRSHHELLKAAASDPRVARIFVFPGAKVKMCNDETGDRAWLRKIRPWYGHHYHFHVRLSCPPGATGCVNQTPPPPGDGCADAQAWVNNILNPPPPDPNAPPPKPKRDLTMGDLPAQCATVLAAQ